MRHNIRFISRKKVCQVVFELVLMSLSGFLFQKSLQLECTFLTNSQEEAEEQCSISVIHVLKSMISSAGWSLGPTRQGGQTFPHYLELEKALVH